MMKKFIDTVIKNIKSIKVFLVILAIAGLLLLTGQKYVESQKSNTTQSETTIAKVEKGTISSSISASGKIATANYLSVTTSVNGIVKKVYVKEGDGVVTGQKLMEITLDSEGEKGRLSAYDSYLKSLNNLKASQRNLPVLESAVFYKNATFEDVKESTSYQTNVEKIAFKIAESDYITALNNLENKKADISEQQIAVNNAWLNYQSQAPTITAPTDGVIVSVLAVEGSKIENSVTSDRSIQTVAAIKKEGSPIASLNIGEVDINNVKVGLKVNLTLSSLGDKKVTGVVAGIDKVGTTEGGVTNYPVTVKFDLGSEQILPNMTVQADIIRAEKNDVLYVPTAAIQVINDTKVVNVIRDGHSQTIEIETGISDSSSTEITSGLNEGEEVIVNTLPTEGFTNSNSNQNRRVGGFELGGPGGFGR